MEKLQLLLKQVSAIVQSDKQHQKERRLRGELFNVFEVLGLSTNETRTHSAFIAELLNPKGDHGLGDKFLQAFIQSIDCLKTLDLNSQSAKVRVEVAIGYKNEDCTEGGRIDILIESEHKAIIIENKIYAGDQEKQLFRYANHGKGYKEQRLLYLTLWGNEASEESCCNLKAGNGYFPIGYSTEILSWLERCIELVARYPLVRETIIQYRDLIKVLTYQNMETKESEKIIETMLQRENTDTIAAIINLQGEWMNRIVKEYLVKPLIEFAKSQNLEFVFEEAMYNKERECGFYFYKPEWKKTAIYFYTENMNWQGKGFYRGVSNYEGETLALPQIQMHSLEGSPSGGWPYGFEYLSQYRNWDCNTMTDMVEGRVAKFIEESVLEMLDEIDQRQLPMP